MKSSLELKRDLDASRKRIIRMKKKLIFITERRETRAGESPKPCGSVDPVVYVMRTAGNAVEKHASPKPHARALSRRVVGRGVCTPTRVRQAPARGRPRVWTYAGHALRLGLRWANGQQ